MKVTIELHRHTEKIPKAVIEWAHRQNEFQIVPLYKKVGGSGQ
jgi:hypothetical protein